MGDKYLSAFATNLSLACELYLKFLLFKSKRKSDSNDNYKIKKHDLLELSNKLKDINPKLYEKVLKEYYSDDFHRRSFEEFLNMNKKVFTYFRYLYECNCNKSIHTTDLGVFANALRKVSNSLSKSN